MGNSRSSIRFVGSLVLVAAASGAEAHEGWGIVSTPDRRIYFADTVRRVVWRLEPDGGVEPAVEGVDTHALVTIADGSVYGSDSGPDPPFGRAYRIDAEGRVHTLVAAGSNGPLGYESFLVDTDGTIYSAARGAGTELLRRRPDGTIERVATEFRAIQAMAWSPDGGILVTDGPFLKYVSQEGAVDTLGGVPLSSPPWEADLAGVTTDGSGGAFVADSTRGQVLDVGRRSGIVVEYATNFPWSVAGVARDAEGLVVLEPLGERWNVLARLQVGPYLRVRRVGVDGRLVTLAVLWGTRTWIAAAVIAIAAAAGIVLHIRGYRRTY